MPGLDEGADPRTFQVQLVALSLLRLLHSRLDRVWEAGTWWQKPAWNHHKRHASILDAPVLALSGGVFATPAQLGGTGENPCAPVAVLGRESC